jgi:hypothetical protein
MSTKGRRIPKIWCTPVDLIVSRPADNSGGMCILRFPKRIRVDAAGESVTLRYSTDESTSTRASDTRRGRQLSRLWFHCVPLTALVPDGFRLIVATLRRIAGARRAWGACVEVVNAPIDSSYSHPDNRCLSPATCRSMHCGESGGIRRNLIWRVTSKPLAVLY